MKKSPPLSSDDLALFQGEISGVRPIRQDTVVHPRQMPAPQVRQQQARREADHYFSDGYQPALPEQGPMRYVRTDFSSYELKRLRRGDYVPELILDLHGCTKAQARHEIIALINECKKQQLECASIMHGLGTGVLRAQIPAWLMQHPDVLAFHQAPLEWGGDSALLLLIDIGQQERADRKID